MNNQVGVIIDFKGAHVGVFSQANVQGKEALRGELMLVANFILRTVSLAKMTDAKKFYITYLHDGIGGLAKLIDNFAGGYEAYYKVDEINLEHKLVENNDREFSFILSYGDTEGHTTRFKPKGFGLFGKNIDASAMFASLLFIDYLLAKYEKKEKVIDLIDKTIQEIAKTVDANNGKLGIKAEWQEIEKIGKMI